MGRYHFWFRDEEVPFIADAEFPSDEVARQEARHCARDLLVERVMKGGGVRPSGAAVRVVGEDGREVGVVDFDDIDPDEIEPAA
ncbi:MAG: hypothetical protein AB7I79_04340 [Rhizobiaceae bacterium]